MNHRFIRQVQIDWDRIDEDSYLHEIPALRDTSTIELTSNITFFSGENGSGKSTLIEAIAVAYGFSAEGGTRNYSFSTYESHSDLHEAVTLVKGIKKPRSSYFLRAESFYNVASKTEDYRDRTPAELYYDKYGGKSFHQHSHGESFLALIENFDEQGLYILDEPEAALSPQRQLSLLHTIARMASHDSQFIIASHSPILLGIPGAAILAFDESGIYPCDYQETDSYQITEMFINNREYLLKRLLSDEETR